MPSLQLARGRGHQREGWLGRWGLHEDLHVQDESDRVDGGRASIFQGCWGDLRAALNATRLDSQEEPTVASRHTPSLQNAMTAVQVRLSSPNSAVLSVREGELAHQQWIDRTGFSRCQARFSGPNG